MTRDRGRGFPGAVVAMPAHTAHCHEHSYCLGAAEDSSNTTVISPSFSFCRSYSSSPGCESEGEGFFPVSVGPGSFSVRHYSSRKELIGIQIASLFAESFGGKSNTSVKTVSFVKVSHNRLAFLFFTIKARVNFFV